MTYSGPGHLLHNRQKLSQSCKSSRAPEMKSPTPFSGTINLNSRIIPPTPFVRHFFVEQLACTLIHATKAGGNSAPIVFSQAPTTESVRASYVNKHCGVPNYFQHSESAVSHHRYSSLNSAPHSLNMNCAGAY